MKKLSIFLLILVLGIVVPVFIISKDNTSYSYNTYIVEQGDTLWDIAKTTDIRPLDKAVCELERINNITPIIYPGQEIRIPVIVENTATKVGNKLDF